MPSSSIQPLTISARDLQGFNRDIASKVRRALDLDAARHLHCAKYDQPNGRSLAYGVVDTSRTLMVANKRRLQNYAFPILQKPTSAVLLSITFNWQAMGARHRFAGAQFVVYLLNGAAARALDADQAQQIMRLEWEGRSENGFFEAPSAGHPHWQIDAIPQERSPVFAAAETLSMDQIDVPASTFWLSRVHLASAARGWSEGDGWSGDQEDAGVHANSPVSLDALSAWTVSGSRYLLQQLGGAIP